MIKKNKFLLADDDSDDRDFFKTALLQMIPGAELITVNDGKQAVEWLSGCSTDHLPSAIIIDYNMPHLNGLEVVEQLKTLLNKPRIVIISMYAERKELKLFSAARVDGYLAKTTPASELIVSLVKIMAGDKIMTVGSQQKEGRPPRNS